jgi:catechol 2,3-dioxygenase-like lactoylglutathione lyase family enzyme
VFEDLKCLPGGEGTLRRVILERSKPIEGPLSQLMGTSHLELIQAIDAPGKKLYEGRYWGDPGFIHLCFDVRNMEAVKAQTEALGHPFVCDSGTDFGMGDADGHFTYVEDPDGTLIEFVETFKIPIAKKLGLYLNLKSKDDRKPLGILKLLRFAKIKRDSIK